MNRVGRLSALAMAVALGHGVMTASASSAQGTVPAVVVRAPTATEAASMAAALDEYTWLAIDMHLHTDHSSDAGIFHQEFDTPESHDTFLDDQRDQAIRLGMDAVAFTDHRSFDQHFDPDYATTDDTLLITGEEWGGGRHGTAFGLVEVLEHADNAECGLAQMSMEAAAQGGLLGIAHPKDSFGGSCIMDPTTGNQWPISHVEAVRGGDGPPQELGLADSTGSNTAWYQLALQGGMRVAAVNGSDNHFKQVWATGPAGAGGSSTQALVAVPSEAGFVEAVRAGRTMGGWSQANVKLTTLLDADQDGEYDAIMGGWAEPTGETVSVAVRAELGTGGFVRVIDDTGAIVAEQPILLPDETFVVEVPAASAFYYATFATTTVTQIGLPDPLDYLDTHIAVASPVWTLAPAASPATSPGLDDGRTLTSPSEAAWSGFADVARDGNTVHVVWQERQDGRQSIGYARSSDGGLTWEPSRVLSSGDDARLPTVALAGERVTVAWEAHDPSGLGGQLMVATSQDGGATFGQGEVLVDGRTWRADLATDGDADHLVWMQQADGEVWSIMHAERTAAGWGDVQQVSTGEAFDGAMTQYAVPPRTLRWTPAAVAPTVDAHDGVVVIAWHDNRDDPTPLRSGSPDDWGIWATTSTDGGTSFSADVRVSPRVLSRDDAEPEGVRGNPARNADAKVLGDGTIVLAYQSPHVTGKDDIFTQRSRDGGATWEAPVGVAGPAPSYRYHPTIAEDGDGSVAVTWQQDEDPLWSLWSAASTDEAGTFAAPTRVTSTGRYAGWPATTAGAIAFTAETADGFQVQAAATPVGATSVTPVPAAPLTPGLPATGAGFASLGLLLAWRASRHRPR